MKQRTPGMVALAAILSLFSLSAYAQDPYKLDATNLKDSHPRTIVVPPGGRSANANKKYGITGIDSIPNFNGSYNTDGYGPSGAYQHTWYYNMAGQSPNGGATTTFHAPVMPVSIELLSRNGDQATYKGHPLYYDATQFVQPILNSPVFQSASYSSSAQPTQITDAVMRAEFYPAGNWHTLLAPAVGSNYVMKIPYGKYYYSTNADDTCCSYILVDYDTFTNLLFPPAAPDATTAVGNAEITGQITTKDISTFLFPNTFLYTGGNPNNCCVLGFHSFDYESGDASNGNLPREYVLNYSSWISPGLFGADFQDVTALSHEMAETFNDPFVASDGVHDVTPWWLSPNGNCQDDLEVGDVIESLPNSTYPITMNNYTYHPQNEALLQWFEFDQNSNAIDGAYSYPDTSTLTALSPVENVNCQ